jgi:nucleotide-binding universal stress UspA family protein
MTTIAHATDNSDDDSALRHAIAFAARSRSKLVTVHVGDRTTTLRASTELSSRWRVSIDHEQRVLDLGEDVIDAVVEELRSTRPTLVVVGTHGRHGVAALLHESVAEAIARNLDVPVMIVPNSVEGLVDPVTGTLAIRRLIIPAGSADEARCGLEAARLIAALASVPDATFELLHVGTVDRALEAFGVPTTRCDGPLKDAIVASAAAREASMIVMPTRGHDGVGDVLRGSRTERVVREALCPVVSVPIAQ